MKRFSNMLVNCDDQHTSMTILRLAFTCCKHNLAAMSSVLSCIMPQESIVVLQVFETTQMHLFGLPAYGRTSRIESLPRNYTGHYG